MRATLLLCVFFCVTAGCAKTDSPAAGSSEAAFRAFAEKLYAALQAECASRSDYDGGIDCGFEPGLEIESFDQTAATKTYVLRIRRYHEIGHHEGKGSTKQTQWTKHRGIQTLRFSPTAEPSGWKLLDCEFEGEVEVKPPSAYTDFSTRTVTPVDDIPAERDVIEAALNRVAKEQAGG